jgi:hypothetical protein
MNADARRLNLKTHSQLIFPYLRLSAFICG